MTRLALGIRTATAKAMARATATAPWPVDGRDSHPSQSARWMGHPLLIGWRRGTGNSTARSALLFFCRAAVGFGNWVFLVAIAYHVEPHEIGGSGFGAGSGDDADDL